LQPVFVSDDAVPTAAREGLPSTAPIVSVLVPTHRGGARGPRARPDDACVAR